MATTSYAPKPLTDEELGLGVPPKPKPVAGATSLDPNAQSLGTGTSASAAGYEQQNTYGPPLAPSDPSQSPANMPPPENLQPQPQADIASQLGLPAGTNVPPPSGTSLSGAGFEQFSTGGQSKLGAPQYAEWGQPGPQDPNDPRAQQYQFQAQGTGGSGVPPGGTDPRTATTGATTASGRPQEASPPSGTGQGTGAEAGLGAAGPGVGEVSKGGPMLPGGKPPVTPPSQQDAFQKNVYDKVLEQLNQDPTDVSKNPALAKQMQQFRQGQTRSTDARLAAQAERNAQSGFAGTGAADAAKERALQDQGDAESGFEAQLVGREIESRRQQVQQALQMGAGIMSEQQKNTLTKELANLNAQVEREGHGVQKYATDIGAQMQKYGIDANTALGMSAQDLQRYGIDKDALVQQRGQDIQKSLGEKGLDLQKSLGEAKNELDRYLGDKGLDLQKALTMSEQELKRYGIDQQTMVDLSAQNIQKTLGLSSQDMQKYGIDKNFILGQMEAANRKESNDISRMLGIGDLELRRLLGTGALDLDRLRIQLQNRQFNDQLGWDIGKYEFEQNKA